MKELMIIPLIAIGHYLAAQAANDNIENKIWLTLDTSHSSNTIDCTVEWECVDEALTGKCIEYHNDQWFAFVPPEQGAYFINIYGQSCRDSRGVQLVLIDGIPCETETYTIIQCVSLATQDDIFVGTSELKPDRVYLLNVDGYLHDFCRFDIEISSQSRGLPVIKEHDQTVDLAEKGGKVLLTWELTPEMESKIVEFQVFKRKGADKKFYPLRTVPVEKNTFGLFKKTYSLGDSLSDTELYVYKIIALPHHGAPLLVDEVTVSRNPFDVEPAQDNTIILDLDYRKGVPVTVIVFNGYTDNVINHVNFDFDEEYRQLSIYTGKWKEQGILKFRVEIINNESKEKETLFFE